MRSPIPATAPGRAGVHIRNLFPVAVGVLTLLLLINFLGQVSTPLLAIILAGILAAALNPITRFLARFMPRGLAAALTVIGTVGVGLVVGALAVPPIAAQFADLVSGLPAELTRLERRAEGWVEDYPQLQQLLHQDTLAAAAQQAAGLAGGLLGGVLGFTVKLVGTLFMGVVTMVMVLFMLANPKPMINGLLRAVPERHRGATTDAVAEILTRLGAWGRATLLVMVIMGVVMGGGLYLLGIENWLVFGVLAALGELIPTIGPILAVTPPILFALADDPQKAIWVAVFSVVVQQLESYVLAPFLLGGAGKMNPLSVTVGVLLFGSVFGLVGAFLTVPFLIVIKALIGHFYLRRRAEVPEQVADALITGELDGRGDPD